MKAYALFLLFFLLIVPVWGQDYHKIDSIHQLISEGDDTTKARLYTQLIHVYNDHNYDSALIVAAKAKVVIDRLGDSLLLAGYHEKIANVYRQGADYKKAREHLDISLDIYTKKAYKLGIFDAISAIGTLYHYRYNDSLAGAYYNEALKIAKELDNRESIAATLSNIGNVLRFTHGDSAINYFNEAIELYQEVNSLLGLSSCYNNLAIIYAGKGDSRKAERFFLKSFDAKKELNNIQGQALTLNNLAFLTYNSALSETKESVKRAMLNKSIAYANRSLKLSLKTNSIYTKRNTYATLLNSYYALGDYKKAMDYQTSFMHAKDSIFSIEQDKHVKELESKYQLQKKEAEIERLEHERRLQKTRQLLILTLSISALIILGIVVVFSFLKRRKDKQISEQQQLNLAKEKQLAESELEKSRLKEEELQKSVVFKSKQLSSHALHMMQKNNILQELHDALASLKVKDENKDKLRQAKLLVNKSLRSDKDWEVFKRYFEEVNENFYQHIQLINPELSTTDLKICALIRLNMDSKEMASVLNVVPNSIKSSRYRLKKKLGLDAETDLEEFIRNI